MFSLPDSGRRCRLSGDRGPLAPSAFLLLCFFGARSSSLRSTPSALLRSSELPLAPTPSPAKLLRSRSLLFGPGVFQWGSAGVPGESLATLTLLRGADFGPSPSPFCSSVQPREFLMCPEGQIPCPLCPDSGRRCRLSGERGPLAPPASLLLCFFGARSSSLRSTPSALPQSSERPLAPAPSPARPLHSRSLLFLGRPRSTQRRPRAHTRVPGCTGPAKQTALKFPNLHRSLSASLRSGSTVLQCPPQLSRSAIAVCPQGWV
ncbi:hypothetical protein NDU88_004453 [Pleurodeles waltl]|uniref:Uncharacterized protein n=1 Tax=Pleurodeles waltl TaxID=8319 RepID=A0AAV7T7U9_PLEWA|nr:hypothetical protein NDU88_004453 [Pleurodeles waltl]